MQPSEEFEQNNFDRIQCALDIVHTIISIRPERCGRSTIIVRHSLMIAMRIIRINLFQFSSTLIIV